VQARDTELRPEAHCCHQQYLKKNPYGYCPDHGTGVSPARSGWASSTGRAWRLSLPRA